MRNIRYVTLDPTGNLTCLVLDTVPPAERPRITTALMDRCEQVGYLLPPHTSPARARLEMMGGEFCGNASMGTASYLVRRSGGRREQELLLEVSGAAKPVSCRVRPLGDGAFEGSLVMPPVLEAASFSLEGERMCLVRLEGIAHLILEDRPLSPGEAERLLLSAAKILPDPAVGLLLWNSRESFMRPLVHVRESGTLVWENGCGSGSTALGAALALRQGDGTFLSVLRQPGGTMQAEACVRQGRVLSVRLTGHVRIGKTAVLSLPDPPAL